MATSDFIIPTIFENPLTKAVFTTRRGGVSKAPYNELNLGDHVKDDLKTVLKNREIVLKECGFKAIAWMNQTHSTKVCKVNLADANCKINADAIVTNARGLGLAVMTADCLAGLLADEKVVDVWLFCESAEETPTTSAMPMMNTTIDMARTNHNALTAFAPFKHSPPLQG